MSHSSMPPPPTEARRPRSCRRCNRSHPGSLFLRGPTTHLPRDANGERRVGQVGPNQLSNNQAQTPRWLPRIRYHAHTHSYPTGTLRNRLPSRGDRRRLRPRLSVVIAVATDDHGVERLIGDLGRWAADSRASDAARARTRERWLRRQAAEEATLPGVALDLAERGDAVVLKTTSGRAHRGRLVAVARDVWVLRSDASHGSGGEDGMAGATFVATDAIASLRAQP